MILGREHVGSCLGFVINVVLHSFGGKNTCHELLKGGSCCCFVGFGIRCQINVIEHLDGLQQVQPTQQ
jgi:hypothetical protein